MQTSEQNTEIKPVSIFCLKKKNSDHLPLQYWKIEMVPPDEIRKSGKTYINFNALDEAYELIKDNWVYEHLASPELKDYMLLRYDIPDFGIIPVKEAAQLDKFMYDKFIRWTVEHNIEPNYFTWLFLEVYNFLYKNQPDTTIYKETSIDLTPNVCLNATLENFLSFEHTLKECLSNEFQIFNGNGFNITSNKTQILDSFKSYISNSPYDLPVLSSTIGFKHFDKKLRPTLAEIIRFYIKQMGYNSLPYISFLSKDGKTLKILCSNIVKIENKTFLLRSGLDRFKIQTLLQNITSIYNEECNIILKVIPKTDIINNINGYIERNSINPAKEKNIKLSK